MWASKYIVVCKQKSSVTKRVAERHCRFHICIRINIASVVDFNISGISENIEGVFAVTVI